MKHLPDENHRPTSDFDTSISRELRDAEMAVRRACETVAARKDSDPPSLRDARILGDIVGKFFAETDTGSFPDLSVPLKTRDEYAHEVDRLKDAMITFRRAVASISQGRNDNVADGRLRDSTVGVVRQMDRVIKTYLDIVNGSFEGTVRQKARDIAEAADEALDGYDPDYGQTYEKPSAVTGESTGSAALGAFFTGRADKERTLADRLRVGVVLVLLIIAALALWILFLSPLSSDTLVQEFARLSTTVPLAVLAGYLGREASRHRTTAERLGELGAHFSNLEGYVAELSDEEKRRYRVELGRHAFVAGEQGTGDTSSHGLIEEAARLVDVLKGAFRS